MKKVLITGASGFVGSHLIDHLLSQGAFDIHGTYRSEKPQGENEHLHFLQVDLQNKDDVTRLLGETSPEWIFHLAAQSHVGVSFQDPLGTITNNVASELNILEAIKDTEKKPRLLAVSTAEVYGLIDPSDLPIDEQTPFRPGNPYAVSKITQDFLALQYYLCYKIDVVRVRPFSHVGPRQSDRFVVGKFAKNIAEMEKGKKEPILKVGNLEAKRDFTDVRDMVRAYQLLMEKGDSGEVYNIGSGESHRVSDVLEKLLSFSEVKITTEEDPALLRPSDVPDLYADITKLTEKTGWKPEIPFEQTLKDTLEYWRGVV